MANRTLLSLGFSFALLLNTGVRADKFAAGPPQPKLFASEHGAYALKILPDASSVGTRTRTEGSHSPVQAVQVIGKSEGVFFTLDESGKEKVIWRAKLANIPNRAILVENGKYVITLDSWRSIGFDHCLVVYGAQGKVIADFKLEDLLTPQEIETLPASVTHRGWSDKDIAEFEDRSREENELVIRMKWKDWTKVIRLSLPSGRIINDGLSAELSNVIVLADDKIELDFVLLNCSDANIALAERWNSWGAYQWEFRVVDAKGAEFALRNPQMNWFRNGFTTFSIPQSKSQVTRCRLDRTSWNSHDGPIAIFSELSSGVGDQGPQNSWALPLSITGTFSAPKANLSVFGEKASTWAGTITTKTVQADEASRPKSSGDVQPKKSSDGEPAIQPQLESSASGR